MDATPLALLVEDRQAQREFRAEVLENAGFHVMQAKDGPSAMAQLRNSPKPDLVVSDANLIEKISTDTSGREFARLVARELKHTIVVVYSANEGLQASLSAAGDDEAAIRFMLKGDLDDFEDKIAKIYEECIQNLAVRWREVEENPASDSFANKADEIGDVRLLRDFAPEHTTSSYPEWHGVRPEKILDQAGFKLKVIDGSIYSDISDAYSPKNVHFPFLIWLRSSNENVYAELYKFPDVAAYARNEEDATKGILKEMRRTRRRLVGKKSPKEHEVLLLSFLDRVLSGAADA